MHRWVKVVSTWMIPWLNEKCIVMAMAEALDIVINVIASKVDIDQ